MRHRKSRGARRQDTPDRCPGGDRVTIRRLSMVFGLLLVSLDNVLLALGIAVAYITYYVAYLPSLRAKRFISEVRWPYLAAFVALILVYNVGCARLFAHYDVSTHPITLTKALSSTLRLSILFPGAFLVQQFLYFGPVFLLFLLYFPRIVSREVRSPGVLLSLLLTVFMGLNL